MDHNCTISQISGNCSFNKITREDPKFSGGKQLRKNFAFDELTFKYGAFGAKTPSGAGQNYFYNFPEIVDFFRSRQMVPFSLI